MPVLRSVHLYICSVQHRLQPPCTPEALSQTIVNTLCGNDHPALDAHACLLSGICSACKTPHVTNSGAWPYHPQMTQASGKIQFPFIAPAEINDVFHRLISDILQLHLLSQNFFLNFLLCFLLRSRNYHHYSSPTRLKSLKVKSLSAKTFGRQYR